MSPRPAPRSADLERLRDDGYSIAVVGGALEVYDIPYVTSERQVARGTLIVPLRMAGDVTMPPDKHHVSWVGGVPCTAEGGRLTEMNVTPIPYSGDQRGINRGMMLCQRPHGREFHDYHELVSSYVAAMGKHAILVDPACTARTGSGVIKDLNERSPFRYIDTATSRASISRFSKRLEGYVIGIVGLGGTGAYVLDLVSKTPVSAIHLFDDDTFDQHNAFRAPGAAAIEDIARGRTKVEHLSSIYLRMHRGIVPHAVRLGRGRLSMLDELSFVFICIDEATEKQQIIARLEHNGTPFVDTGIGVELSSDGLLGLVRVTTSTSENRATARSAIPFLDAGGADPYRTNVQVADLNALNAALAVMRWKRLAGFYRDDLGEHNAVYAIDANRLYNEETPSDTVR